MTSTASDRWPALPLDAWKDTYVTLHMWTQIVGKICLALTPRVNHFWNITLHVTPRGLATPPMPYRDRTFTMTFDFIAHQLVIQCSDGETVALALVPQTVANFYRQLMDLLHRLGIDVRIWTMPVEVPDPIRFDNDVTHRAYDATWAHTLWRVLATIEPVFTEFRSGFVGKSSPVHFFWGSFDLAVTRFSGKRAPERPGADSITREAYSHEVISCGFWPGGGAVTEPVFYVYAAPEPPGFKDAIVQPSAAFYHRELSEFVAPYEAIRTAGAPEAALTSFLSSTYDAAAALAMWNRSELERGRLASAAPAGPRG